MQSHSSQPKIMPKKQKALDPTQLPDELLLHLGTFLDAEDAVSLMIANTTNVGLLPDLKRHQLENLVPTNLRGYFTTEQLEDILKVSHLVSKRLFEDADSKYAQLLRYLFSMPGQLHPNSFYTESKLAMYFIINGCARSHNITEHLAPSLAKLAYQSAREYFYQFYEKNLPKWNHSSR